MSDNTQLDMFEQVDTKIYIREGNAPFIVVHYPSSWDMVDGEWLPQLTQVPVMPGSNLVSGNADNPNIDQLLKLIERKGGTVIDPADPRLGEFQGFLQKRDDLYAIWENNSKCSYHYFGCGITDEIFSDYEGKRLLTFRTDEWRYNEFRKLLVTSGIVKPITDKCIQAINEIKQTVNDRLAMSGRKVEDEQSPPFYSMNYLTAWLREQYDIIKNEQAFFDMLIREGYTEAACIYTLHMSNPPPLEEVMKVTGLGKTTIYNRLKVLRAIEKTDSPDYYVSMNHILAMMGSGFLVLDAIENAINAVREVAKVAGSEEERAGILDLVNETMKRVEDGREKERQLDIKFNTMTDEAFNKAKDNVSAKVLLNGKDAEDLRNYKSMVRKIKNTKNK